MADELKPFPAPAKLNLFLHVTGRRPDGYHLLQSVFRFIDHGDTIWVGIREDGKIRRLEPIPGVTQDSDLTIRAARLLKEKTYCPLGADIRVDKRLPMGGGLGGGSSDAATVLLALNRLWGLGLSRLRLQELAKARRPFLARGSKTQRCPDGLLARANCVCAQRPQPGGRCAVLFIMYHGEVFKPSNTGR